jgi:hypothetical protein
MEDGAAVSQAPVAKRRSPGDEPPAMNAGRWTPGDGRRALNAGARRSRMADGSRAEVRPTGGRAALTERPGELVGGETGPRAGE